MMFIWPSLVLALATPDAGAARPLAPSGKWMVDYADRMCVLQRTFGEGAARVTFGLRPPTLGSMYEVLVMTPDTGGRRAKRGTARMWLAPGSDAVEADYVSYPIAEGRLTTFYIDWSKLSALATSDAVRIEAGDVSIAIAPSQAVRAIEALDACRADLLEGYGLDPAALAAIAQPATAVNGEATWISYTDYPYTALRSEIEGMVEIVWTIAIDGSIGECRVLVSSGHASLDDAACDAITKRGRYRPALDKAGKPIVSWSSRRVLWLVP